MQEREKVEHEQVEDLEMTAGDAEQVKGGISGAGSGDAVPNETLSLNSTKGRSVGPDGILSQHNETLVRT